MPPFGVGSPQVQSGRLQACAVSESQRCRRSGSPPGDLHRLETRSLKIQYRHRYPVEEQGRVACSGHDRRRPIPCVPPDRVGYRADEGLLVRCAKAEGPQAAQTPMAMAWPPTARPFARGKFSPSTSYPRISCQPRTTVALHQIIKPREKGKGKLPRRLQHSSATADQIQNLKSQISNRNPKSQIPTLQCYDMIGVGVLHLGS